MHALTNTTSVPVAVSADATRRAVQRLDLAAPAIRALHALCPNGGRPAAGVAGGPVDVGVAVAIDATSANGCVLTITTAFRATDDQARVRLLDAWPIIGPLAGHLAKRAAYMVREYAESDDVEADALRSQHAEAA
jgi:hypothetical protein